MDSDDHNVHMTIPEIEISNVENDDTEVSKKDHLPYSFNQIPILDKVFEDSDSEDGDAEMTNAVSSELKCVDDSETDS